MKNDIKIAKELIKVAKVLISETISSRLEQDYPNDAKWLDKNHFWFSSWENGYVLSDTGFNVSVAVPKSASGNFIAEASIGRSEVVKSTGKSAKDAVKKAVDGLIRAQENEFKSKQKKLERSLANVKSENDRKVLEKELDWLVSTEKNAIGFLKEYKVKLS